MNTVTPVLWHRAINLTHRKVALASFLRTAQETQSHVYYSTHDPAALVIAEVAALVGVVVLAWDLWGSGRGAGPSVPWVLIRSHSPEEGRHAEWFIPPQAVLCIEPRFMGAEAPTLPPHHRWFITGTGW